MTGDVTLGYLRRVSQLTGSDDGQMIAGQPYYDVYFTGGSITGATITSTSAVITGGSFSGIVTSSAATITGGTITGITDLAVADGGTGASTSSLARINLGLGNISTQSSSAVAITGGTITGITDLAIADGGTGASTSSDARVNLGLGSISTQSSTGVTITGGSIAGTLSSSAATITGGTFDGIVGGNTPAAGTFTSVTGNRFVPNSSTLPTDGLYLSATNTPAIAARSLISASFTNPASSVNYWSFSGAASGGNPTLQTTSSTDANVSMNIRTLGTGAINLQTNTSVTQCIIGHTASAVNWVQLTGGATSSTGVVVVSANGSDSNIDLALTPKGTALVRFGTLTASSDVVITGYISIKDSGGTIRKLATIT